LPRAWPGARDATATTYPNCPSLADRDDIAALRLGDHRRDYLEFEGPLSGNRGSAIRVSEGTYSSEKESSTEWVVTLTGSTIDGRVSLSRSETDASRWTLSCL
jgi:hypothetical protein